MSTVMGHVQGQADRLRQACRRCSDNGASSLASDQARRGVLNAADRHVNDVVRPVWIFHEVNDGSFDEMPVSLNYLRDKYGS